MFFNAAAIAMVLFSISGSMGATINPAASVLLEAIASMETAVATTPSAAPIPTSALEQPDSPNCDTSRIDPRCNRVTSQQDTPSCTNRNDCNAYCQDVFKGFPQVHVGATCQGFWTVNDLSGEPAARWCTCWNGTAPAEIAVDIAMSIGETACVVANQALALSADVLKAIGRLSKSTEMKWAGKILQIGTKILAQGDKMGKCDNAGCPGHNFVIVDPDKLEEELGALSAC